MSVRLGFAGDDLGYLLDLGLPVPGRSAFDRDPEIKREVVFAGDVMRPATTLVERTRPLVRTRTDAGWEILTDGLAAHRSALSELADPARAPELVALRDQLRAWRFYDGFRVDPGSPVRRPQVGTRTPALADDGADLAAALQTVREDDGTALDTTVADAFEGARVQVDVREGLFEVALRQRGMLRPLRASELSDGTLRYLLWTAALLSSRPAPLVVLNEPETSLHPDLLPALGRLVGHASTRTQVVVVTHSALLVQHLEADVRLALVRDEGETLLRGQAALDRPPWRWGSR